MFVAMGDVSYSSARHVTTVISLKLVLCVHLQSTPSKMDTIGATTNCPS